MISIASGGALYREDLYALTIAVINREGSSHGIFIPFLSAYLLWIRFDRIKAIRPQASLLPGGVMVLAGLLLFFLGKNTGFQVSVLSYLCIVGALILVLLGKDVFKEVAFPLFFLATMIPLPTAVYSQIAYWMRQINTLGSVALVKSLGVPLYREGFDVYIPDLHLFVADGCSGIRYLLSYFTFSIIYAVLYKQSNYARLLVILGSIPLAVISGTTRLAAIFLAAHFISPYWAGRQPHIYISWIVFAVFLFGVTGVDQYATRKLRKRREGEGLQR
ncbi:MAG: exosortase/archaeosortase family protein [Candidatus Pacebacteria bacterium]|nr:exosortase/archaeosortase family protein [Candidatus Paceibacterota bacterium]